MRGDAGDDIMIGGAGPQLMLGSTGNDTLTGGAGADRFDFADAWGSDQINDFEIGPTRSAWSM